MKKRFLILFMALVMILGFAMPVLALTPLEYTANNSPSRNVDVSVNVKWFGAIPNDGIDDYQAIQNGINSTPAGGTLYFPPGTYTTSGNFSLTKRIRIAGAGPEKTILNYSGTGKLFTIPGTALNHITYSNISDISLNASSGSGIIKASYADGLVLERVYTYFLGSGFWVELDNSIGAAINDCVTIGQINGHGIYAHDQTNALTIKGGRIDGNLNPDTYGLFYNSGGGCTVIGTVFESWYVGVRVGTTAEITSNVNFYGAYFEGNKYAHAIVGRLDGTSDVAGVGFYNCYGHTSGRGEPAGYGAITFLQCVNPIIIGGRWFNDLAAFEQWYFGKFATGILMEATKTTLSGGAVYGFTHASASGNIQTSDTANQLVGLTQAFNNETFLIGVNKVLFGAAAPVAGAHVQGDICYNTGAAVGQPVGWICTVAGTPGTWQAMPNL